MASQTEKKKNLEQRISAISAEVGGLDKTGKAAAAMGGFSYHTIDDALGHLRPIMAKHGVTLDIVPMFDQCETASEATGGKRLWVSQAWLEIHLINVDDPEDRTCTLSYGLGLDWGDKSWGKAVSYAVKTYLLNRFLMRGQPDNEADGPAEIPATNAQAAPPVNPEDFAVKMASSRQIDALYKLVDEDKRFPNRDVFDDFVRLLPSPSGKPFDVDRLTEKQCKQLSALLKEVKDFSGRPAEVALKAALTAYDEETKLRREPDQEERENDSAPPSLQEQQEVPF